MEAQRAQKEAEQQVAASRQAGEAERAALEQRVRLARQEGSAARAALEATVHRLGTRSDLHQVGSGCKRSLMPVSPDPAKVSTAVWHPADGLAWFKQRLKSDVTTLPAHPAGGQLPKWQDARRTDATVGVYG